MTEQDRRSLLDRAALLLLLGALLVGIAVKRVELGWLLLAFFPIRWGVARVAAACAPRPSPPPPAGKPFGYEQGGPVR
jgi:hypothetical protein